MEDTIKVWIDGASRGNPGRAGAGAIVRDSEGNELDEISKYLGDGLTNNQAEYLALINALKFCNNRGYEEIKIFSDSELLVRQMNGDYDVNSENIIELYEKAKSLELKFQQIDYEHVSRDKNEIADGLANKSIEEEDF